MKIRVFLLFGGRSGEHEISIRSASNVVAAMDPAKYEIVPIAISTDGGRLRPADSAKFLNDAARASLPEGLEKLESIASEILVTDRAFDDTRNSVVFPVLHGPFGEDGTVQGMIEISRLPYVGCGVLASACGMDKVVMRSLFEHAGLPVCRYLWFLRSEWESQREALLKRIASKIGFPCFVKPANLGSSVGVSKATDAGSLAKAIDLAADFDRRIIVEEGLSAREIECGVLGNDDPEASLPGEYVIKDSSKAFLDYDEKYAGTGNNEFVVPALVSEELSNKIRQMSISAFKAIDGSGLARVDFFLRHDNGALLVNEINTMPGLTDASGYPKMWAGSGKPFPEVLDRLIELAFDRFDDKGRNRVERSEGDVLTGGT